eukprot:SAG31_NODE_16424_length_710_cov_0.618658_1_plen_33_part_10
MLAAPSTGATPDADLAALAQSWRRDGYVIVRGL